MKKLTILILCMCLNYFYATAQMLSERIVRDNIYELLLSTTRLKVKSLLLCSETDTINHYFCYQYDPTEKDSTIFYFSEGKQMSVDIQTRNGAVFVSFFNGDTKFTFTDTVTQDGKLKKIKIQSFLVQRPLLDGGKNWIEFKYVEQKYLLWDFERNIDFWSEKIKKELALQN